MPKVSEATDVRSVALERLAWSRGFLEALLAGVPDERLFARAGGAGNHAMWVMGHIAATDAFILGALGAPVPALPQGFDELFGGGSKVLDDPGAYPSRDEVAEALRSSRDALVRWAELLDEAGLRTPMPEDLRPIAPDAITAIIALCAHEMFHAGQIASVRAAAGLPPVMF